MANPAQRKVTDDPGTTDGSPSTEPDEVDAPEADASVGADAEVDADVDTLSTADAGPTDDGSPDGDAATDGGEAEPPVATATSPTSPSPSPAAKVVPPKVVPTKAKALPPKAKAKAKGGVQAAPTRYTPAAPSTGRRGPSPKWVPILMLALWALGLLLIVLYYMGVLPGTADGGNGWYLVAGLVSILAGIMVATQYR
jgi:hypothetical protein